MATKKTGKAVAAPAVSPFRAWADRPDGAAISELCLHVAEGGHMAGFARDKGFHYGTMLSWINADAEKGGRVDMYARAREDRADVLADEIVAIADEVDLRTKQDGEDVVLALDPTAVARNKLRVDARKWVAAKMKPRMYGDKVALTGDNGGPIETRAVTMTDEQLAAIAGKGQ